MATARPVIAHGSDLADLQLHANGTATTEPFLYPAGGGATATFRCQGSADTVAVVTVRAKGALERLRSHCSTGESDVFLPAHDAAVGTPVTISMQASGIEMDLATLAVTRGSNGH